MPEIDIPLSVPSLRGNEWEYVKDCIDTESVSSAGPYVELFEEKIAEYTGARFAVACDNGTSALQVSLKLAGGSAHP
jgi:perosamine synthetase